MLLSVATKAQTVASLADSSFAKHDYPVAYKYYAEALKSEPNNIIYLRRAGFSLMNCQGQELNATRFFAEAIKIKPTDPVANYYLGLIYLDAAKAESKTENKAHFKALAQTYLTNASNYGSSDAKAAIKDLNGI